MKLHVGRPSPYKPDIHPAYAAHLAQEGKTEIEIAEQFGVSPTTITTWKQIHPEFLAAIRSSKEEADSAVERSLYQKAVKGDVIACRYWLSNRQPFKWREKQEIEQSGMVKVEHSGKLDLSIEQVIKEYADSDIGPISTENGPQ